MLNIWTHLVVMFLLTYYTTNRIYFKRGLDYVPIDKLCSWSERKYLIDRIFVYTLFVFVCTYWCPVQSCCVMFLFCLSSSCIPYVASFSGLSIFDCRFDVL